MACMLWSIPFGMSMPSMPDMSWVGSCACTGIPARAAIRQTGASALVPACIFRFMRDPH